MLGNRAGDGGASSSGGGGDDRKRPRTGGTGAALLTEELWTYILDYLSDLDLMQVYQVSRFYHRLVPHVLLMNMRFRADADPIRGSRQRNAMRAAGKHAISAAEHGAGALAALRQAFQIHGLSQRFRATGPARILLYRVSDKKLLTDAEVKRFVVPGPFWTVEKTAAWILGGMFHRLPFVLLTAPTSETSFREGAVSRRDASTQPAIYAREIMQLLGNDYRIDFAREHERPFHFRERTDILVLRPPPSERRLMAEARTRLSPALWDRAQRDATLLITTVEGIPVTADALHEYFQRAMDSLRIATQMTARYMALEAERQSGESAASSSGGAAGGGGGSMDDDDDA